MDQKRLGLITKAMMVVPGHCLAQASREFLHLYPTAKILVADETNFAKAKRQRFMARAATGDWDCIIITHAAFNFIPIPRRLRARHDRRPDRANSRTCSRPSTTPIAAARSHRADQGGFEAKLEGLKNEKDDLLTISEIGVDQIIVDEAQEFRKLAFADQPWAP